MNTSYLIQGLALGIAAGLLPGPVMVIMIAQVLREGRMAAVKISLGASLMDIIRIVVVFLLLSALPKNPVIVGSIAIAGAIFLLYMAYSSFNYKIDLTERPSEGNSLLLGMLSNLLNSSTYLFWITVGGPIMLTAQVKGLVQETFLFAASFSIAVFVINLTIGLLAAKIKVYMKSVYYIYVLRLLAIVLVFFALLFLRQAYQSFMM